MNDYVQVGFLSRKSDKVAYGIAYEWHAPLQTYAIVHVNVQSLESVMAQMGMSKQQLVKMLKEKVSWNRSRVMLVGKGCKCI